MINYERSGKHIRKNAGENIINTESTKAAQRIQRRSEVDQGQSGAVGMYVLGEY